MTDFGEIRYMRPTNKAAGLCTCFTNNGAFEGKHFLQAPIPITFTGTVNFVR
jgi:hypothetical protein